jgi:hypothetical protein
MGLFDRFSKDGGVERATKKVLNKHAQSADRFSALEKLRDVGTEDAMYGMARRFSFVYDKTIEDEQEKEWVEQALVAFGDRALKPLARYLKEAESLAWPLRVLDKIARPEQVLEILDQLLEREEPGYTRDPSKKLQMLSFLGDWKRAGDADVARRVVPYLADFDENVRFQAIEAIHHHPEEGAAKGPLLDALVRPEEESRRIKVRIAELLASVGWTVTTHKDRVAPMLTSTLPEYGMTHDKLVRKKEK